MSFRTAQHEDLNIISCPDLNSEEIVKVLEMQIKMWQLSPANIHLFDFKEVRNIRPEVFRILTQFNRRLKENGKVMATSNLNKNLENDIVQKGLKNVFSPVSHLNEAKKLVKF